MFDSEVSDKAEYAQIFDERGDNYHRAMQLNPFARKSEFLEPLNLCDIQPHQTVLDFPSGGGYLQRYLQQSNKYICAESSEVFASFCKQKGYDVTYVENDSIDLPSASVDRIVSIAGMHHVESKLALFKAFKRLLRPAGIACIADVKANSAVALFLDDVVDRYTSTGHSGIYFSNDTKRELLDAGFSNVEQHLLNYFWRFESTEQMIQYCRLLFSLNASDHEILNGIQQYLEVKISDSEVLLSWQLICFRAN